MNTQRTSARRTVLTSGLEHLRSDAGMALTTVVAMSVILFLLATALLTLATGLISATESQTAVTKATHMADAGLNAYLYELRRDPTYYVSHDTLEGELEDGRWVVTAEPPAAPGDPLVLHATGAIPSMGTTNTVTAEVRFPTYAEYIFLSDADINIGADAVIYGRIRSNGDIDNKGRVTGRAFAAGSITVSGAGVFDDGFEANQPAVDFSQVTVDMQAMKQVAQDSGTYYGASGGSGYYARLSGTQVVVSRVTGGTSTGNLTKSQIAILTVPASGVLYFNEDVWVSGTYSTKLTIAGARDIYIDDNLGPQNMSSPHTCGLVAQRSVIVPSWYPNLPNNMTLTAAMLAQTGSIYGDYHTGVTKNKITINGSMAYSDYGYFALYSGSTVTAGFKSRSYNYDQRLEVEPPPMYPRLRDGSLRINTWFEE
jgi:hypothetical protein